MPTSSAVLSLFIDGPAGRLESLLNTGAPDARYAALVCHPHPLYGGTMHNKVVYHTMKALNGFGFPVLRFNFRGNGLSQGMHDYGHGEVDDVRATLDWLDREFRRPIIFAGFSFGAAVGLRAACSDVRVAATIGVGTPLQVEDHQYGYGFLRACTKPKLFVSGSRDQFGPRTELERMVAALPAPRQLTLIDEADHFFEGHLEQLRKIVENWVREQLML